uniref:C2H2-type domain-containing protein n=1 Tax=Setaria digitata TaxID=48799 RepID=A0A915PPH3_9BILA
MSERFPCGMPPKAFINFAEHPGVINGPAKQAPVYPDFFGSHAVATSKKRILLNSPMAKAGFGFVDNKYAELKRKKTGVPIERHETMIELGHVKTVDTLVSNIACRRHFHGYEGYDTIANEPLLHCAICHSKVLKKYLELHAWMHLSWVVQVGDRHPFQCTRCDFTAFRIPDVVCHTNEIHGNMDANLFIPNVPYEILQYFFDKVIECFPPMNYKI